MTFNHYDWYHLTTGIAYSQRVYAGFATISPKSLSVWRSISSRLTGRKGKEELGPHGQETHSDNISTYFEWESTKSVPRRADSDTTVT